jgi:hypothetical protein
MKYAIENTQIQTNQFISSITISRKLSSKEESDLDIEKNCPKCSEWRAAWNPLRRCLVPRHPGRLENCPHYIFKKGNPADFGNFRTISLLSTLYKLFSGVMASWLCTIARNNGWLYKEKIDFCTRCSQNTGALHAPWNCHRRGQVPKSQPPSAGWTWQMP